MALKPVCRICQKPATGIHYRVLACAGCKAFFRRATARSANYTCQAGTGSCSTQANIGLRCRACRLSKCVTMGMRIPGSPLSIVHDEHSDLPDQKEPMDIAPMYEEPLIGSDDNENDANTNSPQESYFSYNGSPAGDSTCRTTISHANSDDQDSPPDDRRPVYSCPALIWNDASDDADNRSDSEHDRRGHNRLECCPDSKSQESLPMYHIPDMLTNSPRISPDTFSQFTFVPFDPQYTGNYGENRLASVSTVRTVDAAIQMVFGDQIVHWTVCLDRARQGATVKQPETTVENMIAAINWHNSDNVSRIQRFAAILPGMSDLDPAARKSTKVGWKWLVYALIHHAAFMDEENVYITVGPQQFRYCRYWQDIISKQPYTIFIYKFCTLFREIGLDQVERYLLLAMVMFEPSITDPAAKNVHLVILHRHYTDVLFDHIKHRCQDANELTNICRRLERFFSIFKIAYGVHKHYFCIEGHQTPTDSLAAQAHVKLVQRQIENADNHQDEPDYTNL